MVEFFYWLKNEVGGDFYLNFLFFFFSLRLSLACLTDFWKILFPAQWGPKMPCPLKLMTPQVEQVNGGGNKIALTVQLMYP